MSTDDRLRKTLASKFETFEAAVGEENWNSIKSGIANTPSRRAVLWRRLSVGLLVLLLTVVSTWLVVGSNDTEPATRELTGDHKTIKQTDNQVTIHPEDNSISDTNKQVQEKPAELVNLQDVTAVLTGKVKNTSRQESEDKMEAMPVTDVTIESEEQATIVGPLTEIPSYQFKRPGDQPERLRLFGAANDSASRQDRRVSFRPLLGLSLNYLNLRPNPGDNIYFTDIGTSIDLSLQQWGLNAGYEICVQLGKGLRLRNELNLSLQQHRISFRYLPDASDSENKGFLSVEKTFRPLSLGIASGLSYDLGELGLQNRELDMGLYYQSVLDDDLGNSALLEYPDGLLNMNMGLTFYPQKINWGIRVFSYFALNKKYSERALTMTPYGFGVQFLRRRSRY